MNRFTESVEYVALQKRDGSVWAWIYNHPAGAMQSIRQTAANPDLSFTVFDAEILCNKISLEAEVSK